MNIVAPHKYNLSVGQVFHLAWKKFFGAPKQLSDELQSKLEKLEPSSPSIAQQAFLDQHELLSG